jgi:hypothetical protein
MPRRKKTEPEYVRTEPQEYIDALHSYPSYVKLLPPKDGPYERIRSWFLVYASTPRAKDSPNLKTIAAESGIEYTRVKKQLESIYYDICDLNRKEPKRFLRPGQRLYEVFFHYRKTSASFFIGLDETPSVGDSFDFPFIFPQLKIAFFGVGSVDHELIDGEHTISLTAGILEMNKYKDLLMDKALMLGNITIEERIGFVSQDLLRKLVKLYPEL